MYDFKDKAGRGLTLRPEGTAGLARAFIENGLHMAKAPAKFYYNISAFRYEAPQAGRFREFRQFGIEYFGSRSPFCDAEVIAVACEIFTRLGIKAKVKLNSVGGPECRKKYVGELKNFLLPMLDELCPDCKERFNKNPLRVLDCKNPKCWGKISNAPSILDVLGVECKARFQTLKTILENLNIECEVDEKLVRGLDYYTQTVFEFFSESFNSALGGGGRYDNLIKELGGPEIPGAGFAFGVDRIAAVLMADETRSLTESAKPDLYVGSVGEKPSLAAAQIAAQLRGDGFSVETDIIGRSVKAQLKYADAINAKNVVVIGENELNAGTVEIKNMSDGTKKTVLIGDIKENLNKEDLIKENLNKENLIKNLRLGKNL
jgi:histidyl-tRNA synthetase